MGILWRFSRGKPLAQPTLRHFAPPWAISRSHLAKKMRKLVKFLQEITEHIYIYINMYIYILQILYMHVYKIL